jgi:outer membrane protein assembly factor BamA
VIAAHGRGLGRVTALAICAIPSAGVRAVFRILLAYGIAMFVAMTVARAHGPASPVDPPAPPPPTDPPPTEPPPTDDPETIRATDATDAADATTMRKSGADLLGPPPDLTPPLGEAPLPSVVDLADPMAPVLAGLDALRDKGVAVGPIDRSTNPLQGEILTTTLDATDHAWTQFVLERVAADGYAVLLRPAGADQYELIVLRARPGQERGLAFLGVDGVDILGEFRPGETRETVAKLVDVSAGLLIPLEVAEALRPVGYRATLRPSAAGRVEVRVVPGRAIRRVRVQGHTPLFEREVRRVLSVDARPGALAPGPCVDHSALRTRAQRAALPKLCQPGDLVCEAWEQSERGRVERYLFDEGYLRGTVDFAFVCGKHADEAELRVVLRKRKGYRVRNTTVTGNLATGDQRWVRRVFKPTFGPVLPIPKRLTRKHVEAAREKVEREYATPRSGPRSRSRRGLTLPYPGVRVETNFDRMRPADVPEGKRIELQVDVQLGKGVDTGFLGDARVSENRLRSQLQIFERREAANPATASREAANLRGYYQGRGFMLAQVTGKFQDFGGLHKLTFDIAEGPRVRVRDVVLERPSSVPPVVLDGIEREVGRSRGLKSGGRFTDVAARKDLGVVLAAYAKRGYLCARGRVRVAFWESGLTEQGSYAILDLSTELEDAGTPAWLSAPDTGLSPAGLAAIRARKRAGTWVVLEIEPGPRVITSSREDVHHLEIPIPASREVESLPETTGQWGAPRMLRGGPLRRRGDELGGRIPLTLTKDREVERDVVRRYQDEGYPLADAELRWVYTDTSGVAHRVASADRLTDDSIGLCRDRQLEKAVTIDTELSVYEGRRARFGTTLVRGNFKTRYRRRNGRPAALAREIEWREGDVWGKGVVDRTRANIDGMGVTENVVIREQSRNCTLDSDPSKPCVVHQVVSITESKDRGMDIEWGFGGATLDPLYGFVRPSFPNMWGTAWDLALDAHVGANLPSFQDLFCVGEDCYERSGRVSLTRRRIGGSPLTFDITGQVQRRVTPARGQIDSALGHVRLTWPINRKWTVFAGYLFQAANISKDLAKPTLGADSTCNGRPCRPPNRGEAIVPDRTGALQTGVRWEQVDNAFNPDDGIIATGEAMLASPCLGGQDWWARLDFAWEHFIPLPGPNRRWNFRYALTYGHAIPIPLPRRCARGTDSRTTSVPEVWRYFGGGTRDLGLRGILPQTMLLDVEQIEGPYGTKTLRPTAEGGHIRALGTVALQVVSIRNFAGGRLAHSLFFDFGVLTQQWRQVVWARDFRRSVGVNFIKWDIRIVTVSLGYAVLIPNRIWPGNVRLVDDRNGRFVFDVGATF